MNKVDLNLLFTLDALLAEGSVSGAATRLGLDKSGTSRALTRLRAATGDPLLVRAGRKSVLTPKAAAMRETVGQIVAASQKVLSPGAPLDLRSLKGVFQVQVADAWMQNFGHKLLERVAREAPGVCLRFVSLCEASTKGLHNGTIALVVGMLKRKAEPDIRAQKLYSDRLIGVVRQGHALTRAKAVTQAGLASEKGLLISTASVREAPVNQGWHAFHAQSGIAAVVNSFANALAVVRKSDFYAIVPERSTANMRDGLATFRLPINEPEHAISMVWHVRRDGDPAHEWLRTCVLDACSENAGQTNNRPRVVIRRMRPV